jgi:hypothetical protein
MVANSFIRQEVDRQRSRTPTSNRECLQNESFLQIIAHEGNTLEGKR